MTSHNMSTGAAHQPAAARALRWIGDLDHPYYQDERNRFVWYEASAIGFQLLFVSLYFLAGAMLWIGGVSAMPYALATLFTAIAAASAVVTYSKWHHAEYAPTRADLTRPRGRVVVFVGLFVLSGFVRASLGIDNGTDAEGATGFVGGFSEGLRYGAIVFAVACFVGYLVALRRSD